MKLILIVFTILILILTTSLVESDSKKLKKYVEKFEPKYKWSLNATYNVNNAQVFILELVSQEWMKDHTDLPVWKHWLQICKPNNYSSTHKTGFLVVDGGYNTNWTVPTAQNLNLFGSLVCSTSNELTATLLQVPNQFIEFDNDGVQRKEDDIVALTWRKYMDTKDATWTSLFPQTKAAIKAMDAVQEFGKTVTGNYDIEKFIATGGSKRGWTVWGAAMSGDKRVKAIVPVVIPVLNLAKIIENQMRVYGNWSFALADYVNHEIPSFLYTKYFEKLEKIIDPIHYQKTTKNIPKYIIVATNDEFFPGDSTKFFYDKIKGEKRLGVYPNTNHQGILKQQVIDDVVKYFKLVANDLQVPEIKWENSFSLDKESGTIKMDIVKGTPIKIQVWIGSTISTVRRDFRTLTCPSIECYQNIVWTPQSVNITQSGSYSFTLSKPTAGWSGFFYQVDFETASFTSEVVIVPDINPFPKCSKQVCGSGKPSFKKVANDENQDIEDNDSNTDN